MRTDIELIKETFITRIKYGIVTVSGVNKQVPIFRAVATAEDEITVDLYLDDTISGNITKAQLILDNGQVIRERSNLGSKDETYGLLVGFKWKLSAVDTN
jgi:hypothetical protein